MRWCLRKCNDGFWGRQCGSGGYGGGLYTVSELKARSLSSRNTLGDTTHNTNKIGLSWGGFVKAQWNCGMAMMGCGVRNAEMEGKVVDYTRCRSWKRGP